MKQSTTVEIYCTVECLAKLIHFLPDIEFPSYSYLNNFTGHFQIYLG